MNTCPPEIHAIIFSYACTDDGRAGVALARVSRYTRQASMPYQWHSLAISGITQARKFAERLEQVQVEPDADSSVIARARPMPIRHLFLSDRVSHDSTNIYAYSNSSDQWHTCEVEWPKYQSAILQYAAPTLETLSLSLFDAFFNSALYAASVLDIRFPVLEELTLRVRCTPLQLTYAARRDSFINGFAAPIDFRILDTDGVFDSVDGSGSVSDDSNEHAEASSSLVPPYDHLSARPKLRRLHLACAYHGFAYGTEATHGILNLISPELTHLRITMLDMWGCKRVAEVLHSECASRGMVDATLELAPLIPSHSHSHSPSHSHLHLSHLGIITTTSSGSAQRSLSPRFSVSTAKEVTWPPILPAPLEQFVLQPPPTVINDFYCSCCMELRGDADVMRVFDAMSKSQVKGPGEPGTERRFVYVPAKYKMGYGYDEAKVDWMQRVQGGAGCWADRSAEETMMAAAAEFSRTEAGHESLAGMALTRPSVVAERRSRLRKLWEKIKFW